MQEHRHVRQRIETCTAPSEWRFLNARFGHCTECHRKFQHAEVIVWHVRTNDALHPACVADKHPHLADWIENATRWKQRV